MRELEKTNEISVGPVQIGDVTCQNGSVESSLLNNRKEISDSGGVPAWAMLVSCVKLQRLQDALLVASGKHRNFHRGNIDQFKSHGRNSKSTWNQSAQRRLRSVPCKSGTKNQCSNNERFNFPFRDHTKEKSGPLLVEFWNATCCQAEKTRDAAHYRMSNCSC